MLGYLDINRKDSPITREALQPVWFYPEDTIVEDIPYGNMSGLRDKVIDEEVIFIMFYAPWCRRSKAARSEFRKAANVLIGKVKFMSINCFLRTGQCYQTLKLVSYPQFYAYHTILNGYRYTGVHVASVMVSFLERVLHPLTSLYTPAQTTQFTTQQDNSIVGYFEFGGVHEPPEYLQFYYAAMRATAKDPTQPVRFAVTSYRAVVAAYNMTRPGDVVLVRHFHTAIKYSGNMTSSGIAAWIDSNSVRSCVEWLSPPHSKSNLLSRHMTGDATLFLFTKSDPLWELHPYFFMLQDISEAYHDCKNASVSERRGTDMYTNATRKYLDTLKMCSRKTTRYQKNNNIKYCERSSGEKQKHCESCQHDAQSSRNPYTGFGTRIISVNIPRNMCIDAQHYTQVCYDRHKVECQESMRYCNDVKVLHAPSHRREYLCRRLRSQQMTSSSALLKTTRDIFSRVDLSAIQAFQCRTNRTLNFISIDPQQHREISDVYMRGVNGAGVVWPRVIIVDLKSESHYHMNGSVTAANIMAFITNYTNNELTRTIHGQSQPFTTSGTPSPAGSSVRVRQLTSHTFMSTVMDDTKDVLVYMFSRWCAFCSRDNHVYLELAQYFHTSPHIIFTRIDADQNELPWQLTVQRYPTIIFFPRNRKTESVVYPSDIHRSLPNLIKFVLRHASDLVRLHMATVICSQSCVARNHLRVARAIHSLRRHMRWLTGKISVKARHLSDHVYDRDELLARKRVLQAQLFYLHRNLGRCRRQVDRARVLLGSLTSTNGHTLTDFFRENKFTSHFDKRKIDRYSAKPHN